MTHTILFIVNNLWLVGFLLTVVCAIVVFILERLNK